MRAPWKISVVARNGIAFHLTVPLIALILIWCAAFAVVFEKYLRTDLMAVYSKQLLDLSAYVAQDIDKDVTRRRDFLEDIAAYTARTGGFDAANRRAWSAAVRDSGSLFPLGIRLADLDGRILAIGAGAPVAAADERVDADLAAAAAHGFALGRARLGAASRMPEIAMAVPVRDAKGSVRALLVGTTQLRCPNFLGALSRTKVGGSGGLVLVSPRDRMFLASSDADISLLPVPAPGVHPQHDAAMNGFRGIGVDVRADGIEELAAVASVPTPDWFIVARIPTAEIFAPVARMRKFVFGVAAASCIVLAASLFFFMHVSLRHLRRAAVHADLMTQGKAAFESLPVGRNDEVGHLTAAFNRLLATLLASRAELDRLAHLDSLTGIANRKRFTDELTRRLSHARRHADAFALLFIDLDRFKPINDTYGHDAGDEVLRQVALRLSGVTRREDLLARIGGDEFALLVGDLKDAAAETARIVAKCEEVAAQPILYRGRELFVGVSLGAAIYPADGETADDLLRHADHAMYRVKSAKGGRA